MSTETKTKYFASTLLRRKKLMKMSMKFDKFVSLSLILYGSGIEKQVTRSGNGYPLPHTFGWTVEGM